ncbi:hypothetical protein MBH78_01980 [Oceanimonas sp. NS1]|nr:hypothetical protein [Oceanimonas sp. NS1]
MRPWNAGRHTFVGKLVLGGSTAEQPLPVFARSLGGLFNLSGYQSEQLSGRYSGLAGVFITIAGPTTTLVPFAHRSIWAVHWSGAGYGTPEARWAGATRSPPAAYSLASTPTGARSIWPTARVKK